MIEKGFIEEVEKLEKMGLKNNYSASQAIGYRQCLKYLDSKKTYDDKINFIKEYPLNIIKI